MKANLKRSHSWAILGIFWLVAGIGDRIWFALDRRVPAWDQADYLTGALNYWQALQHPQWWNSDWWTSLWQLSSKIPPVTYIITAVFHQVFGIGADRATGVNLFFSAILLYSIYGLGCELFNCKIGLWAAGLCLLFPGLYHVRLDFLLDYPLTAIVTLCFYCLTVWKYRPYFSWLWAIAFGLSLGLALMVKQTAILFLLMPILWIVVRTIWRRQWGRVAQLLVSFLLAIAVMYPWYRTNWLLILTGSKRATVDAAIAEGDPTLNSLGAWTFYLHQLPDHISWPLLIVTIGGFLLYGWRRKDRVSQLIRQKSSQPGQVSKENSYENAPDRPPLNRAQLSQASQSKLSPWGWLLVFWLGSYLLCSLNVNKDYRYVLPYLPVVAIFLADGLTLWRSRWGQWIRWGTIGLMLLLMVVNLWPVNDLSALKPTARHAYMGQAWPHEKAIAEIIEIEPYVRSTLGVLPSTATVNQHNFNYYGALANFQVYGRQVGTRRSQVVQDVRSLNWFIVKTGDQGSVPIDAQTATVQQVQQSPDFQLHKTWPLPDGSMLQLYHRQSPPIQVKTSHIVPLSQVKLQNVMLPAAAPPGQPVPVTYQWLGNWEELQHGLVVMTWKQATETSKNTKKVEVISPNLASNTEILAEHSTIHQQSNRWFHDRAIGLGTLYSGDRLHNAHQNSFQLTEKLAMLPPSDVIPGLYTLEAKYLNRETGESYPLEVPSVQIKIDPTATPTPAPELDLVTQLRSLSRILPLGLDKLGPVFDDVGRINQYDPIQDYLTQAQLTLNYRLAQEPNNLELAYNLALAEVVNRDAKGAIAALETVVQLDSENPYAHGYLAFVNLYDLRPNVAEKALKPALKLDPTREEFQILNAVAALFQGNLFKTWNASRQFIPDSIQSVLEKTILSLSIFIGALFLSVLLFFLRKKL